MRPTDADALMPLFVKKANTMKDRHGVKLGDEWLLSYNDIKDVIDNAPTVEFPEQITIKCDTEEDKQKLLSALRNAKLQVFIEEERPQGEWITRHKLNSFGQDVVCFECNKCGEYKVPLYHLLITEPLKVCPNCGADMRGKENE